RARLQAERDTLSRQLAEAEQALGRGQAAQEGLRAELAAALRRAERAQAEANATRHQATARRRAPTTRTKFKPGSA
ncbi:KfrA protein, partial [Cupriavidus sp. 2MCAB6]